MKTPYEFVKEHQSMLWDKGINLNLVHIEGHGNRRPHPWFICFWEALHLLASRDRR